MHGNLDMNIRYVDATERFLQALRGVIDPEQKRRIVGREFISVFEAEATSLGRIDFLAQGTLYPDVIESTAPDVAATASKIKTHQTVGVMGDYRTYANLVAVRVVTSEDAMTADWARVPYEVLARISNRIVNEVNGVNRVVFDITSKPPGTIEWE